MFDINFPLLNPSTRGNTQIALLLLFLNQQLKNKSNNEIQIEKGRLS